MLSYPSEPRAIGGGDPLAGVPRPVECSRRRAARGYTPLRTLQQRAADNPFVTGDRGSVALEYSNAKRQRFRIHLSGTTPAILKRFVAVSSACLEAFALPKPPGATVEPVRFDVLLVRAAVTETGKSQTGLATIRDQLVDAGQPAALEDVVTEAGGDPGAVVAAAAADAASALAALVAAGHVTATEVSAFDVPANMTSLAALPDAPFLFASSEITPGTGQLAKKLLTDERGVIVLGVILLGQEPGKQNVVLYALSSLLSLSTGKTHDFVAQCRYSAWVEIYSSSGSQRVSFWRKSPYYLWLGQKLASDAVSAPGKLGPHSSWPKKRSYDTSVYGVSGGKYSIFGAQTWSLVSGGGCPT